MFRTASASCALAASAPRALNSIASLETITTHPLESTVRVQASTDSFSTGATAPGSFVCKGRGGWGVQRVRREMTKSMADRNG